MSPPRPWSPRPLGPLARLVIAVAAAGFFLGSYYLVADLTGGRSYDLTTRLDEAVPLLVWTFWFYVPAYAVEILGTVLLVREPFLLRGAVSVFLGQGVNTVFYLALPSNYPRAAWFEGVDLVGLSGAGLRWVHSIDPANNTFPSAHVMVGVLCAYWAWRDGTSWWKPAALCAAAVFVSVLTLKQHYWVDGVAAIVVAAAAAAVVERVLPVDAAALPPR